MVTYIKYTVKGHYATFENELSPELYDNIGTTWEDYLAKKWVKLSEEQIDFKSNNPSASVYEVFHMQLQEIIGPERTLETAKSEMREEIKRYDESDEVNMFYIQGSPVWLDKATRTGLKLRFEAELAMGQTDTTLWYGNQQFPLTLENAIQMLYAIEIYASACYDNTQKHLSEIDAIDSIELVDAYDFTTGYPEKINF